MLTLHHGETVGPWTVQKLLGTGEYGSVYSVCDKLGSTEYALKVAPIKKQASKNKLALLLIHEISYLRTRLQAFRKDSDEIPHFPHGNGLSAEYICGTAKDKKIQYLAMEKLEKTLSGYLVDCGGKMSKGDAYCTAARSIQILKFLHNKCVIFNDIKSDNFMLRRTENGYQLVILDFGASEIKYGGKKIPSQGPRGTPLFASINNLKQGYMFFSDDLAAVGYMVAYLLLGELPWSHARSVEEIIAQKQSGELRAQISEYPELVAFFDSFEKVNTDNVDYDKWIQFFAKAAAKYGNKSADLLLPFVDDKPVVKEKKAVKEKQIVKEKVVKEKPAVKEKKIVKEKPVVKEKKAVKEKQIVKEKKAVKEKTVAEKKATQNKKATLNHTLVVKSQKQSIDILPQKGSKKSSIQSTSSKTPAMETSEIPRRIQPPRRCKKQ